MADFVEMLTAMGFDKNHAMKAVEKTGNKGVELAMEWMLANPAEPAEKVENNSSSDGGAATATTGGGGTEEKPGTDAASAATAAADDQVPKSWKCEDCGKLFSTMDTVEFHAAKTNHSNFSESTEEKKPLTAEEKEEQQKKLVELMKAKRIEREAKEKVEEIDREKQRMASGKELVEAKRRLQEQEMKELIEERKREKMEDKRAKDRVKAMIEADKLARKAKFGGGGESSTEVQNQPAPRVTEVTPMEVDKKEYTETKLQMRLPTGKTMTQTFGVAEPLAAVRVFVEVNRDDGVSGSNFNLMTNFPRRIFVEEDYAKPLSALGLVPSAVLMVFDRDRMRRMAQMAAEMPSGKELADAKRRLHEQEMKELIEDRKRAKMEDQLAKDRVKAMIEADKLERKAKFGGCGGESSTEVQNQPASSAQITTMEVDKKEYKETKLQIRLPNGKTMTETFGVAEPLAAVRVFIQINRDDGVNGRSNFNLMTSFPRRIFQDEDYAKTLSALGLVPSGILMVIN